MAFWEFLIQKEGDRSWLPLESPDVEILEGRYRVVARTSRLNTPVDIRITHVDEEDDNPKHRVQKRTGTTNPEGLIVVVPFVELTPGSWELRCTGDLMADMMGQGWQYAVKLQVLPLGVDVPEDWDADWHGDFGMVALPDETPNTLQIEPDQPILELDDRPDEVIAQPIAVPPVEATGIKELASRVQKILAKAEAEATEAVDSVMDVFDSAVEPIVAMEGAGENGSNANATGIHDVDIHDAVIHGTDTDGARRDEIALDMPESELSESLMQAEPLLETVESEPAIAASSSREEPTAEVYEDLADEPLTPEQVLAAIAAVEAEVKAALPPQEPVSPLRAVHIPQPETLSLQLEQDYFTARPREEITLTGHINTSDTSEPLAHLPPVMLRITLRNPNSGEVLVSMRRSLTSRQIPCPFSCTLTPPPVQTSLLVGDIALMSLAGDEPTPIDSHGFSISADLEQLLEAIANQYSGEDELGEAEDEITRVDETFLNLTAQPVVPFVDLQPATGQILPPQLYRPRPSAEPMKALQLPLVPTRPPAPPSLFDALPPVDSGVLPEAPAIADQAMADQAMADQVPEVTKVAGAIAGVDAQSVPSVEPAAKDRIADIPTAWNTFQTVFKAPSLPLASPVIAPRPPVQVEVPPSPEDQAFQALNLQTRFLARLSALAADAEFTHNLWSDPAAAAHANASPSGAIVPVPSPEAAQAAGEPRPPEPLRFIPPEIVIDDETLLPPFRTASLFRLHEHTAEAKPITLPEDEPVPAPRVHLANTELVSGDRVEVGLSIPNLPVRMAIKFWIQDCQSRQILDGPRWLMNLAPNAYGELEAWASVTIPPGCLELEFGAIAVEVNTQRESRKTTIERRIMPPNLPILSFDELEI
ncbi:hypothetical protein ACQ4M4_00795 [Leptolyngbya sp. AN02str]|uniref:hypothetical protein n=1 Tax=Leptolyngbya sp. AN02str TaxID=3423363 RepID=UPI003D3204AF